MDIRQEVLQTLFENNIFTHNMSELSRTLGYPSGSRSTVGRAKSGKRPLSANKLNVLYEKLAEVYFYPEEELKEIAASIEYAKNLFACMRELYGTGKEWHNAVFGALLREDYSALPKSQEEYFRELKETKLLEPERYYGMLAYFYIQCKDIFPYGKQNLKKLPLQLDEFNSVLHECFPSDNRSYEATQKTIEILLYDEEQSILKLIYNFRHIIRGYVDDSYFENFLREMGHLLDVGEDSFWIEPEGTFCEGCVLWYFSVVPTKSMHRGLYIAMRLRATGNATDSFELTDSYNIMFLADENNDNDRAMQIYDIKSGEIEYAQFRYDEEERLLHISYYDDGERTPKLPKLMRCIDKASPKDVGEKVWLNITERLLDEKCHKYLLTAVNSSQSCNIEYIADYDVTNVCIDRKSVTVTFENEKGTEKKSYSIAIGAYPFFEQLTPLEFVSVVRYKDSGELAFTWNDLGQTIPLSEFEENCH
ncbi:MAG: hypothetical protein IKZ37_08060 [Bacteroidaceae bacterium]|nr:hypothetical protein [Bacteroidaceae bacterium]